MNRSPEFVTMYDFDPSFLAAASVKKPFRTFL